jgi:hypothetical protein
VNQVLPAGWYGKAMFEAQTMYSTDWEDNPTLGCVQWTEPGTGNVSHIFGTPGGNFMVDTPGGALFAFPDAASSSFDPTRAGTYTALVYEKSVSYASGDETGSPSVSTAEVTITAAGHITVVSGGDTVVDDATLQPFAGSDWQGPGLITDPTPGLFYFLDTQNAVGGYATPPMFVTFFHDAVAFGEFDPIATGADTDPKTPAQYHYIYGIAVRAPGQ